MKHTILAQMLGNFRMEYDGKPLCAERMHRDGQFVRMMQAILYFAKKGISKDKLEEYVVGELEMDVPHTALRVMVYKTKKKLKELGVEGENLIYLKDGMYYWTDEIEVASDAAEFRKKYEQILEMQDRQENPDTIADMCMDAIYLYKGEFLQNYIAESWIAQEAREYSGLLRKYVETASAIFRDKKDWKALEELGEYVSRVEPYYNWEILTMEAIIKSGHHQEAMDYYNRIVDKYLKECGIYPSTELLEMMDYHAIEEVHADNILDNIKEKMFDDSDKPSGGYFCSYPVFRGIYQFSCRRMERNNYVTYLMLCSLVDKEEKLIADKQMLDSLMETLKESIAGSIRKSDIFMQYSGCQYLLLLVLNDEAEADLVEERINQAFMEKEKSKKKKYRIHCSFAEIS